MSTAWGAGRWAATCIIVVAAACSTGGEPTAMLAPPNAAMVGSAMETPYTAFALGLPTGGYIYGQAHDINNAGKVVGEAYAAVGSEPFVWTTDAGFRRLATTSALPYGSARSVNSDGFVTGVIYMPPRRSDAVIWNPDGTLLRVIPGLDPAGNPWAYQINDKGQVVGQGVLASDNSTYVAYRYSRVKGMEILPTLGGPHAAAYGINESGAVAGQATTSDLAWHPTVWSPSNVPTLLGAIPDAYSTNPWAINDAGVVAGYAHYTTTPTFLPVVWRTPGQAELLPLPAGAISGVATTIDDAGNVFGWAFMPRRVAVVWSVRAGPRILPQTPATVDAIPFGTSRCGKLAGGGSGQWVVWDRPC